MSADERVDVVDEQDRVVRTATRAEVRAENLLHRCIGVLCVNAASEIYVHRRTDSKDVFPGMHDTFVAGVVGAGESYESCALRELDEELGIRGAALHPLFKHRYDDPDTRSWTMVYRVQWDGPIVHQPSEIAWGAYMSVPEILEKRGEWTFVPDGWQLFERWLDESGAE